MAAAGFAVADDALFGFDPHQRRIERRDAPEIADVLLRFGNGNVQPGRLYGAIFMNRSRRARL